MLFVTSKKMREIDKLATQRFAIPSLILMENAGRSVAQEAQKMLKGGSASVAIFCGYGNNGGDGFVVARHLSNKGYNVKVFLVGPRKKMSEDTKINFNIITKIRIKTRKIINIKQIDVALRNLKRPQLIIDAVFGIGVRGKLGNFFCLLFEKINSLGVPILSIDIPSGLDADKGVPLPVAIKAKKTVTMGLMKRGFMESFAKKYLGKTIIADISLPSKLK